PKHGMRGPLRCRGRTLNTRVTSQAKGAQAMAGSDREISTLASADAPAGVVVREGDYGESVMTVEPGGAEFIPLHERHGRPVNLFWTWTSPNLEFATVFVGVLAVAAFGLSFWQAVLAILIGTAGG